MARPRKIYNQPEAVSEPPKESVKPKSDPLIKTLAEVEALSQKEKDAFRKAQGTTTSNPI